MSDVTRQANAFDRSAPDFVTSPATRAAMTAKRSGDKSPPPNPSAVLTPTTINSRYNMPGSVVATEHRQRSFVELLKSAGLTDLAIKLLETRRAALGRWCDDEGIETDPSWSAWQMQQAIAEHAIEKHRALRDALAGLSMGAG